jgi:hypothetical protein
VTEINEDRIWIEKSFGEHPNKEFDMEVEKLKLR